MLPEALAPFVEKRLERALTGHWQVRVAEKVRVQAGPNGDIAWDQAALLNAMDRFSTDAFKTVLGRAERLIVNELVAVRNKLSRNEAFTYDDAERALDSMRRLMEAIGAGVPAERLGKMRARSFALGSPSFNATRSAAKLGGWWRFSSTRSEACCPGARSSSRTRTSRRASSCRRSSPPISARSTLAARLRNTAICGSSSAAPI